MTAMHKERERKRKKAVDAAAGNGGEEAPMPQPRPCHPPSLCLAKDGCAEGLNGSVPVRGLLSIVLLCLM